MKKSKSTHKIYVQGKSAPSPYRPYLDWHQQKNKPKGERVPHLKMEDFPAPGHSICYIFAKGEAEFNQRKASYYSMLRHAGYIFGIRFALKRLTTGHDEWGYTVTHNGFYCVGDE